jgi:hypothetical protein
LSALFNCHDARGPEAQSIGFICVVLDLQRQGPLSVLLEPLFQAQFRFCQAELLLHLIAKTCGWGPEFPKGRAQPKYIIEPDKVSQPVTEDAELGPCLIAQS